MTTDPENRLFSAPSQPPPSTRWIHTKSMPLIVMNYSAIHGHMEYDEPTTCSLHQFLSGSSILKAAVAGDCSVAIELASKLMQNQPIFFVFTALWCGHIYMAIRSMMSPKHALCISFYRAVRFWKRRSPVIAVLRSNLLQSWCRISQYFFVFFTASKIYPKMMHNELENESCRRYIKK